MQKTKTRWKLPPLVTPIALLGANVAGKPNFFTIAWFNMLQDDPPLLGAGMSKTHYTRRGIEDNQTFSINIPSAQMAEIVDYCGLYSGSRVDKSSLFEVFYGELATAPMVKECPCNIECKLLECKELNSTVLVIGEIVQIYCEKRYLSGDNPDYQKMDPLLFFMPEGPYIKAGDVIAKAFEVGKDYKT
ncbi:flavin reductase family protein [candidate division KSB1 bacterium]|nr:flavin reductase family protein [candidate division KSB1 bacterium]